jgi:small subunit ribosomal protein S24e
MEIEILKQKKLPLLSRERVTGFAHFEGATPSRLKIRQALAKKINKKEDGVVVRHLYQRFGENKAKIIAHVYNDTAMMQQLEPATLLKKHVAKVEEKKEGE